MLRAILTNARAHHLALSAVLVITAHSAGWAANEPWLRVPQSCIVLGRADTVPQPAALRTKGRLDRPSESWQIEWHAETGLPSSMSGWSPFGNSDSPLATAKQFIAQYRPLFTGLWPVQDSCDITFHLVDSSRTRRGFREMVFEERYKGIPVHHSASNGIGRVAVSVDPIYGVVGTAGSTLRIRGLDNRPGMPPEIALGALLDSLAPDSTTVKSMPQLVVYPSPDRPFLAYATDVAVIRDGPYWINHYVTDASNGALIEVFGVEQIRRPTSKEIEAENKKLRARVRGWLRQMRTISGSFGHVAVARNTFAKDALARLDANSPEPCRVTWDSYSGLPQTVRLRKWCPEEMQAEQVARGFISRYEPMVTGLPVDTDTSKVRFQLISTAARPGGATALTFRTLYEGIPVREHGPMIVVDSGGCLQRFSRIGHVLHDSDFGTALSRDQIEETVRGQIAPDSIERFTGCDPLILARDTMASVYLVESIVRTEKGPSTFNVLVGAASGEIIQVLEFYDDWRAPRARHTPPQEQEEEKTDTIVPQASPSTLRDWQRLRPPPHPTNIQPSAVALEALALLNAQSPRPWDVDWSESTGLPKSIAGRTAEPFTGPLQDAAAEFLLEWFPLFTGLTRAAAYAETDLEFRELQRADQARFRVTMQQTYNGIPVDRRQVSVDFDSTFHIVRVWASLHPMDQAPSNVLAEFSEAISCLRELLAPDSLAPVEPAQLVIYPSTPARFAYVFECEIKTFTYGHNGIFGPIWLRYQLIVDAEISEILAVTPIRHRMY